MRTVQLAPPPRARLLSFGDPRQSAPCSRPPLEPWTRRARRLVGAAPSPAADPPAAPVAAPAPAP
eukprot:3722096-Alexandrium_andersonii.AAC.1